MRATVGFDRMMNLLDSAGRFENAPAYPPYNIEKLGESEYRITMAVAGFAEDELDVTVKENSLVITGRQDKAEEDQGRYLHRGIATRAFERRFELADHIQVTGARIENGLLHVDLVREIPEAMKPRSITIESKAPKAQKVIDQKAA
jgi:molecular chaperone IbpA